jgi:hypothetical protein
MKIVGWIVGILIVIVVIFNISKKLLCTRDSSVKEVALPLATVIIKHIEKNDVPESLKDIKEISYKLKDCKQTTHKIDMGDHFTIEERESCYFENNNKTYNLKTEYSYDDGKIYNKILYIDIQQYKTTYVYRIDYDRKMGKWEYENFPRANVYYNYDNRICSPKFFRFLTTD